MPGNLQNLEIFATGTHRAQTGSLTVVDEDLDHIIDAFNALQGSNIVKPHLKLGHTDAQKWFGQKDGIPTLGWITKVWRQGRKLLANVENVPDPLIDMIKSGRFHNVSAEIFWDQPIKDGERTFPRVLSAVSILGVEMPAVKDLAGLASALFQTEPAHSFTDGTAISIETIEEGDPIMPDPTGSEGKVMLSTEQHESLVSAAVKVAVEEAEAKFAEDTKSLKTELEVATTRADGAEAELVTVKASAATEQAEALVDGAIKDGKLLPKQKEFAMAALTSPTVMLKFGDGEKSMPELFKEFIELSGKVIDTSEGGDGSNKVVEFATAAAEVDYKTKALMDKDAKLEYTIAMDKVLASDGDLKARYIDMQQ